MREERIIWPVLVLAIIAYLLPWVTNNAAGLTMGAYDFAEWLSKIPIGESRVYNSVFLLRGQLFLLTCFITFGAKKPFFTADWWLRFILGILLVIAQLPALNLLPNIATDINRQQQVILAGLSLIALGLGLSGVVSRWWGFLSFALAILAITTSIYGLVLGIELMRAYNLAANLGLGAIIYVGLALLFLLSRILRLKSSKAQTVVKASLL
jgi:hypothetical protein